MDMYEILTHCDHTLLRTTATAGEVRALIDEAIQYRCASVCIPPCHVAGAARYAAGRMRICTVIGFPNGYQTAAVKAFEARDAAANGADEIDMVINLCLVKDRCWDALAAEIAAVRAAASGKVLKVIVETACLEPDELVHLCAIVSDSGAEYIKTSTGFASRGASFEDVEVMRSCSAPALRIKAAGGIGTLADAERFLSLGADRLGTSRLVGLVRAAEERAYVSPKTDMQPEEGSAPKTEAESEVKPGDR